MGKLGVSNRILDSPAKLGPEERAAVERHPMHTWRILQQVGAFSDFAWTAATHHEKLDGSGYPWRLPGGELDLAAMEVIGRDRGGKLCAVAVDALGAWAGARADAEGESAVQPRAA